MKITTLYKQYIICNFIGKIVFCVNICKIQISLGLKLIFANFVANFFVHFKITVYIF